MDIKEFQARLLKLVALAEQNENALTSEQINETFEGLDLTQEHMASVLKYIEEKHITIDGVTFAPSSEDAEAAEDENTEGEPQDQGLSEADREYLDAYLNTLANDDFGQMSSDQDYAAELFDRMADGDTFAKAALTQIYLPVSAQIAATYHRQAAAVKMTFPDLLQEANISLLCALEEEEPIYKDDAWLRSAISAGIVDALKEQQDTLHADNQLVAKVEKLDKAIREAAEEDEDYSLDRLSSMLDMDVEEMRSILHLTGDDSEE